MLSRSSDLRVLVVADDPLARAGLAALLADQPGCTIVGQIAGDADLPAELEVYLPEVIVWDLGWDPVLAIEHLADLRNASSPPIVALVSDESHAAEARDSGARGLLLRDADAPTVLLAARAVHQGLIILAPELAIEAPPGRERAPSPLTEGITPREFEVLQLLSQGLSNKTIAYRLGISEHTVKFHVNSIMSKLGAQSRTEAATRAARLGLLTL